MDLELDPSRYLTQALEDEASDGLEMLIQEKLKTLVDIILDIEIEIRKRGELSLQMIREIERHYSYVKSKIFALDWGAGLENRRLTLEKQLDILHTEIRREQLQKWQDPQPLKQELRHWLKKYRDLKQRTQLITSRNSTSRSKATLNPRAASS